MDFLLYYTHETKEHIFIYLEKSVRSCIPHLTSYITTQLMDPLSLEKLELFGLFHVRLHGNEPSFKQ